MTATVVPQTTEQREARRLALLARAKALGWRGQNEIARRIGMDPGHFSRVLAGERVSGPAWEAAELEIAKAERRKKNGRRSAETLAAS